jgi:1-acyl-sn-glycerol-3-phosphate acyltransferase
MRSHALPILPACKRNVADKDTLTPSQLALTLRGILFWLVFAVGTFSYAWAVIFCVLAPIRWRYALMHAWARFCIAALRLICGLSYEVEGRQHMPAQPVVIFSKHQSTYETIALIDIFQPISWVLKRELLWIPIFGWALALVGPAAINRSAGTREIYQVVNKGTQSLQKGRWVVIFPEGTRRPPGSPPDYRAGGAILAAKSGYPVLPLAHNAGEFWPRSSFLKWPGKITFAIGPLITTQDKKPEEILKQAEQWIENKMREISDPARWNR